jgi:hypothetical protein
MDHTSLLDRFLVDMKESVLIVTDLEPDDMIAIRMLLPELFKRNIVPDIVISCWDDVHKKASFVRQCLKELTNLPIDLYCGMPTEKKYDISSMLNSLIEEDNFESWEVLDWSQYSLIIQLAHVNELMSTYLQNTDIFNTTKLAIYASFNIRSVLHKYTADQVLVMLKSFN